jgi:cytochrome c553
MRMQLKSILAAAVLAIAALSQTSDKPPAWAYGTEPPEPPPSKTPKTPDLAPHHIADCKLEFTMAQIRNPFGPADWFPGDHPEMPPVVANGAKPEVWACSYCHYPNGKGRAENAGVSGLPAAYFIQTMHDFKNGDRYSADPRKKNTANMIRFAKNMTDEQIREAAEYFAKMPWTPWIKVVETKTVPKTTTSVGLYLPIEGPGAGTEPLGHRLIEVPVKPEDTELLRDPHSGFIAYAPVGSLHRGEALVKTGAGETTACAICHGAGLQGMGPVPGIAGRSPSYIARQLYDIQQGTRKGTWSALMKPVVSKLSNDDLIDIAAYTASLDPSSM